LNCTRLSKIKLFHKLGVSSCYKWSSFCLQSFAHCCSLLIILHSQLSVYLVLQTVTFSQDICSTMYFLNLISSSFFYLLYFIYLFFLVLLPCYMVFRILVPHPGIKPVPPASEAQSLNHWTIRETPL